MKKREKISKNKKSQKNISTNLKKTILTTLLTTLLTSLIAIILAITVQLNGQKSLNACSYLDPIIIDILAFLAGVFLIVEGLARIFEHPNATIKRQLTRIIRIAAGFAILTLHIMQFIHK